MKVAALDLGTNSFLCLVADVKSGRISEIYSDQVEIVRLGQDVNKTKKLQPEALARAKECLTRFKSVIDQHSPQAILAMATSAARDATNREELFKICRELKIPLEIIPGNKEAEITYRGSTSAYSDECCRLIVDIGGGSTEFILGQGKKIINSFSLDIGAVRLTERFFHIQPPNETEWDNIQKEVSKQIQSAKARIEANLTELKSNSLLDQMEILAVAGTPTELVRAELGTFDPKKIDGFALTDEKLKNWVESFLNTTPKERTDNFQIHAGRADVILAGTLILQKTIEIFAKSEMKVSTRGVRFGVALELAERQSK